MRRLVMSSTNSLIWLTQNNNEPKYTHHMRCNVGVNPANLFDQHLVAESVELKMVTGMMRYRINNNQKFGKSPPSFRLGKGHILFFTDKLAYLARRLDLINKEMRSREFKPGAPDYIDPSEFGDEYNNDWSPSIKDSNLIRARITEKVRAKDLGFWRMNRIAIDRENDLSKILDDLHKCQLFEA